MMDVTAIEFDDDGNMIRAKGTFKKSKVWFSKITDKVMYWAELEIDYCGG